jgi:hypothetical protein
VVERNGAVYVTVMFVALGGPGPASFATSAAVAGTGAPSTVVDEIVSPVSPPPGEEPPAPPPAEPPSEPAPPDVVDGAHETVDDALELAPDLPTP